ncbi:hypothetical protein D3C73_1514530 [compost metagenome]
MVDVFLGIVGAVRDRQEAAHVRGHGFLALVHGVDVADIHGTAIQQELSGLVNRCVTVGCSAVQHHAFAEQDTFTFGGLTFDGGNRLGDMRTVAGGY